MSKQFSKKKEATFISAKTGTNKPIFDIPNMAVIGIFSVLIIIFFWGHISGNAFMWEDFMEMYYPFQFFAAKGFHAGQIPFWNPYVFAGMPFTADLQNGFFYIGHQIIYALSGGNLSSYLLQFFLILHYLIAMIGAWKLAKNLGISNWGSLLSGIVYGVSGFIVVRMIHHAVLFHLAWFPLIVALFYKAVTQRNFYNSFLCAIVLGITMLSGHPQMTLYIIFFLALLTIFILITDFKNPDKQGSIMLAGLNAIIPVLLGVGIFAIQFLPSQELAPISRRAEMTYEKSLDGAMTLTQSVTLALPKVLGYSGAEPAPDSEFWYEGKQRYYYWETVIYFGVVGLILMVVGLAGKRLGSLKWFLLGMGLLGFFYGMGDNFFIHPIIWNLPLFKLFRNPVRMACFLVLGASVLAGSGLDTIIFSNQTDLQEKNKLAKISLIAGLAVAFLGLLTVSGFIPSLFNAPQELAKSSASSGIMALLGGLSVGLVSFFAIKGRLPITGAAVAILALCVIDLFSFGIKQNQGTLSPDQTFQATDQEPSMQNLKVNLPSNIFRVNMRNREGMLMKRNQGCVSNMMLIEGYNPLLLQRIIPPAKDEATSNDLLNVKYGIQSDGKGGAGLAERTTAFTHARFVYNVVVAKDDSAAAEAMRSTTINFAKTAVVSQESNTENKDLSGLQGTPDSTTKTGIANITSYNNQQITIEANTNQKGLLVLSEIWFPAWKVYIDSKEAELLRTNFSLRGVVVPQGKHKIEFKYESEAFSKGAMLTAISTLFSVVGVIIFGLKQRAAKKII